MYGDEHLLFPSNEALIQSAVENDDENEEIEVATTVPVGLTHEEAITINEDIGNINLTKASATGLPIYVEATPETKKARKFSKNNKKGKSPFIEYHGAFIRKSTALYLLQENKQLSNDRLLRVRASQPGHLFNGESESGLDEENIVRSGDLCFFERIDSEKILIGRVIQFSYLEGNKKDRQYSSTYVDMSLESSKNIGVFANWYQATHNSLLSSKVSFIPVDNFTTGYLSMENFISTIKESLLEDSETASFSISKDNLKKIKPKWEKVLTFDIDMN